MKKFLILFTLISVTFAVLAQRPNVLFVISDDQSFPHASAYGSKIVSTPAFDFVAKKGCLFTNAYATSPVCSPSRASILTGLYPWQLEEAGTFASTFPIKFSCFPDILKDRGYFIGHTGKGWAPGNWKMSIRPYNPAGPEYNDIHLKSPYTGISSIDYSANFKKFLSERPEDTPFCFWLGAHEPHRNFEQGSWSKAGYSLSKAEIPAFLPNTDIVRGDILDYAVEIEWFDKQLMSCIEELRRIGELDNTIIIVTSDNGMPFPKAKANCYDYGVRVPLAICWGNKIKGSQVIDALVSLINIAPTIYEAVGMRVNISISGTSMIPLMENNKDQYKVDAVFMGRERYLYSRHNNLGYPMRAIRWNQYLLIHNQKNNLLPMGVSRMLDEKGSLVSAYNDIDDSPTKFYLIRNNQEPNIKPYFDVAVSKRPEFELYDISKDRSCSNNLINDKKYAGAIFTMKRLLRAKLISTNDTRLGLNPDIWDSYSFIEGITRKFPATQ